MQLVQPSKFFSDTINFLEHILARTRAKLGYVVIFSNAKKISIPVQLLWELHALFSEVVYTPLIPYISFYCNLTIWQNGLR